MHKPLKSLAVALAACAATLLAGRSALVSVSTNTTLGGTYQAPQYTPTTAAFQDVHTPTLFETNVYLHDAPTTPLHLRLPATSNTVVASLNGLRGDVSIAAGSSNVTVSAAGGTLTIDTGYGFDWYVAKTNGDWIIEQGGFYGFRLSNGIFLPLQVSTNNLGGNVTLGRNASAVNIGQYATNISFGFMGANVKVAPGVTNITIAEGSSTTNFHIYNNPVFDDGLSFPGSTNKLEYLNGGLTYGGEPIGGGGGGGLSSGRVSATNTTVDSSDYLIWLDTRTFSSSDSVTLTLSDMAADSQTIVVRRLGGTGTATIERGTNTWTLAYDGDGVTIDWLAAATNWFWRTF